MAFRHRNPTHPRHDPEDDLEDDRFADEHRLGRRSPSRSPSRPPSESPEPEDCLAPPDRTTPSSWQDASHGPQPRPAWVITDSSATDTDLGVVKTGKEADVHLVERAAPDVGAVSLLAAKRYRDPEHRMFHRDAGYQEGRRVRRSRETRAMARRTSFGRDLLAGQWAAAEFAALCRLWQLTHRRPTGALVPYPVQLLDREVILEFIGERDGSPAPRLAQLRPSGDVLHGLWSQTLEAMTVLARDGLAHGDLSAYNLLVHRGRLVLIDLPQVVDVVANPQGRDYLARDVRNVVAWFRARGLPHALADEHLITEDLLGEVGLAAVGRW